MKLSIIVARALNGVIGLDGKMPWHVPEDLKRFRRITSGHAVIMGRRTYESIGRTLPDRTNIVVSNTMWHGLDDNGAWVVGSFNEALDLCAELRHEEAFAIGGEGILRKALLQAQTVHLTTIHKLPKGDTFFPDEFDPDVWHVAESEWHPGFDFAILNRKETA
jgi:dihydrofolate reductase